MQILTSLQEEVLRIFAETQEAELFYLTGGTAKSFYEILASGEKMNTPIHLALDSPFRFEEPREKFLGVKVDSLLDITTNKLLTVC
ncbi:MAG: hypothetical protein Q8R31_03260 [Candidatus Omnitrophota bacterium]|nr:hypothetical protein [Candidatus Omnitrophota bacterium]